MTDDFTTWLRKWWRVGRLPYEQGIVRDLTNLCGQQHDALEGALAWLDTGVIDISKQATVDAGHAAIRAAESFQERYA